MLAIPVTIALNKVSFSCAHKTTPYVIAAKSTALHLTRFTRMGDLSKEQEQAIARSTMYLVAALTILMISIAGLFLAQNLKTSPAESGDFTANRSSTEGRARSRGLGHLDETRSSHAAHRTPELWLIKEESRCCSQAAPSIQLRARSEVTVASTGPCIEIGTVFPRPRVGPASFDRR